MECKRCGADNPPAKRTCMECGAILEGYTVNNVTGEYGYRGSDGGWYKSEEEYREAIKEKIIEGYGYVISEKFEWFEAGDLFEGLYDGNLRHIRSGIIVTPTPELKKLFHSLDGPIDKVALARQDAMLEDFMKNFPRHPGEYEPSKPYSKNDCILHNGVKMVCRGDGTDDYFKMKRRFKWIKVVLVSWTAFCVLYGLFGLVSFVTTISNVLFMAFLLWMVRHEEKRRDDEFLKI